MSAGTREWFGEPFEVVTAQYGGRTRLVKLRDAHGNDLGAVVESDEEGVAHLKRARDCLNACRGLPDPEAAIGRLVASARRAKNGLLSAASMARGQVDHGLCDEYLDRADSLQATLAPFLAARKERDRG